MLLCKRNGGGLYGFEPRLDLSVWIWPGLMSATGLVIRPSAAAAAALRWLGEEALEGEARGVLLGLLFGGSLGFGEGAGAAFFVFDADFDAEAFLMVGAALVGEDVVGLTGAGGLEMFLQRGFVVADGSAEGVAALQGERGDQAE